MADGKTHRRIGAISGGGTALVKARGSKPLAQTLETIGGIGGGYIGGMLPDVLEPALTPRHRSIGHSVAAAGAILTVVDQGVGRAQTYCRGQAAVWDARAAAALDDWSRFLATMIASFWHLAAGFFAGVQGGYVSHLLLDAMTPAGLPLLG